MLSDNHSTEMLSDVLGALSLKKNYLFWISANQKRDHPGGPRSDWLNSTKETQRFPESRPSLHFHFFRSRDSDPGYGNYCLWLNRHIWDQWWIYNWELVCAIKAKTVVVVAALNRSASRNLFHFLALMQVKLPQDPFPQKVIISLMPRAVPAWAITLLVFLQSFNKPTCDEKCRVKIGGPWPC